MHRVFCVYAVVRHFCACSTCPSSVGTLCICAYTFLKWGFCLFLFYFGVLGGGSNLTIFLLLPVPFTRRVEAKTQTNKCTSKISLGGLMNLGWSSMSCITLRETASVSICVPLNLYFDFIVLLGLRTILTLWINIEDFTCIYYRGRKF